MSDADPDAVTVSADGITARKTVDTEQFQTLAVVVELASERDEVARVQLVDQVPPDVPIEDVGFHPQYGSEHWSVEKDTVAFERDFEPGEAYTTIYGIRDFPPEEIEALLTEPQLGLVDTGPDGLDEVVDERRSEVVREFVSGEADLPGLEDEITAQAAEAAAAAAEAANELADDTDEAEVDAEPATEPAEVETAEADVAAGADTEPEGEPEPAGAEAPEPEPTDETAVEAGLEPEPTDETAADAAEAAVEEVDVGDEPRAVRVPLTGGVVRVLIKELREGDIDPEDRRMLRDALLGTEGTTDARIAHLQQRVSDLEAYADALEAFIDEEGTAKAVIANLRDDVASLEREVRSIDDRLDETLDDVRATDDRIDSVADDVTAIDARADALGDRVEDAEDDIAGVDSRFDDLGGRLDRLSTDVDGLDDRLGDVDAQVGGLRDELQSSRRDLSDDIEKLAADLEDFEAFRDRLSSVFGGGAEESLGDEGAGDGTDDETDDA